MMTFEERIRLPDVTFDPAKRTYEVAGGNWVLPLEVPKEEKTPFYFWKTDWDLPVLDVKREHRNGGKAPSIYYHDDIPDNLDEMVFRESKPNVKARRFQELFVGGTYLLATDKVCEVLQQHCAGDISVYRRPVLTRDDKDAGIYLNIIILHRVECIIDFERTLFCLNRLGSFPGFYTHGMHGPVGVRADMPDFACAWHWDGRNIPSSQYRDIHRNHPFFSERLVQALRSSGARGMLFENVAKDKDGRLARLQQIKKEAGL